MFLINFVSLYDLLLFNVVGTIIGGSQLATAARMSPYVAAPGFERVSSAALRIVPSLAMLTLPSTLWRSKRMRLMAAALGKGCEYSLSRAASVLVNQKLPAMKPSAVTSGCYRLFFMASMSASCAIGVFSKTQEVASTL